jgi:hypothetical protein
VRNRFVLAYHGEARDSYNDELDLVYRNFLLLDKHDKALVVEGDLEQLEAFLARYNLKSWVVIQSENTSPLLWSDAFPKKDVTNCLKCSTRFQPLWFDEARASCYSCEPLDYHYDTAYPDIQPGGSPEVDLRRSSDLDACSNCGSPTHWISTLFGVGVPTCSKQCTDAMWRAYQQS